jgi:hypothetical protein
MAAGWEWFAAVRSPVARLRPGAHRHVLQLHERPDMKIVGMLRDAGLKSHRYQGTTTILPTQRGLGSGPVSRDGAYSGESLRRGGRDIVMDAAVPGGLAFAVGAADWATVDPQVLDAIAHLTHAEVDGVLDLWGVVGERDYALGSVDFMRMLRGHVGEQEVFAQLGSWAQDGLQIPLASNHPGSDLSLSGHDINVKVGADTSTIAEHLRVHPDIPVIVNEDMAGLPDDALHLDLSQPFDVDVLAEHSVIVADGLLLSDLHDQLADAFGPILGGLDPGDLVDSASELGIPVLGSAVRVVRSGFREQKLHAHHQDLGRTIGNIAADVGIVGGSVAAGGWIGGAIGAAIDIGTGGATLGLGSAVVGPAIGAVLGGIFGGKVSADRRLAPLRRAQGAVSEAVLAYDATVTEQQEHANREWRENIVPPAENTARGIAQDLREQVEVIRVHARADLRHANQQLADGSRDALTGVERNIEAHPGLLGAVARRRLAAWRTGTRAALCADDLAGVVDALLAARAGAPIAKRLLHDHSQRSGVLLAAEAEHARRIRAAAVRHRVRLVADLRAQQDRLLFEFRSACHPSAYEVWDRTSVVRDELIATGTRDPEWVAEHLPPSEAPTPPEPSHAERV